MAHWCEGFLHGLVSTKKNEKLKDLLGAEPISELIPDLLQISRATADEEDGAESAAEAFEELYEYIRVAAQLIYEELAAFRDSERPDKKNECSARKLH
jgi:uncharacterized protein YgfB (UPF0149 family)